MMPESIIVYDSPLQKAFFEDPAGTIGMFAPVVPWFVTILTAMIIYGGIEKLDMIMYRRSISNRRSIYRACWIAGIVSIYYAYRLSHAWIWSC